MYSIKKEQKLKIVKCIKPPVASPRSEKWAHLNCIKSRTTYYISTHGRIYSNYGRGVLKLGLLSGHPMFSWTPPKDELLTAPKRWSKEGKVDPRQCMTVQRLVAATFIIKPSPMYDTVVHLDHVKINNKVDNLRWAKPKEAFHNSVKSPNWRWSQKGEAGQKLTPDDVMHIKVLLDPANKTHTIADLADMWGVAEMQIFRIQNGDIWGTVPGYMKPKVVQAKIPDADIVEIKNLINQKVPGVEIAKRFDIGPTQVSRIKRGKYYNSKS